MVIEPSHLPSAGKGTSDVDADDALIVSMLLGDGTHAKFSRTSFHTTNNVLVDAFTGALRRKGAEFSIGGYNRENTLSGKNIVEFQVRIYGGKEGYKRKLREMGIIGQRTADKSVTFFEKLDKRDVVVAALNGFIATDGYVSAAHRPENKSSPISVEIGYVTTSRQLAHQVSFLFRKLGVYCHIRHRQHDNGISKRVQYIVNVRDLENAEKVAAFLEPPGKEEAVEKLRLVIELSRSARKTNLVPLTNSTLLDMIAAKGKTLSGFRGGFASNLARNESYTTAAKVRAVAGYINDDELLKKVSPDIIWQPITSIEEAQPCTTYDITVRDNHNFFANGVLVHNCLDELQDFLTTEIPVIMECTSHFPDASNLMAGTPKSHDNPIEVYWQATTQGEWLVPCPHCGKWNFLDENNIGPTDWYVSKRLPPGPICKKCQKPINPATGQWVEFYPDNMIKGFRVPQLMVPWICGLHEQWLKLLWKRDNYPFGQFNNEVLGLSYDSASKPITRDELMEACHDYGLWNLSTPEGIRIAQAEAKKWSLTAGVDWGEGNDGSEKSPSGKIRNASYTVIAIGAYITQKHWKLFYAKRFEGREIDPDFVVREITRICQLLGVKLIGTDWGHGWGVNNILMRTFGPNRVAQFQYMPKLRQRMKWDAIGYRYQLQRNFIMSELFFDMKHALIQFPRWRDFEPFAKDILAIYAEYNEYRREIKFDHRPSDPDDFFHSLNLAKLMSDIMTGKSRRYTIDAVQVEGPVG
jgi:hypothetical protein